MVVVSGDRHLGAAVCHRLQSTTEGRIIRIFYIGKITSALTVHRLNNVLQVPPLSHLGWKYNRCFSRFNY